MSKTLPILSEGPREAGCSEPSAAARPETEARVWRSLEELASTRGFEAKLHREFPPGASSWDEGVDRRRFLQVSSASLALAGLSGCTRQPYEKIVPYVRQPEELVPGKPLFYASAAPSGGYGVGVLAESHMGRPTKIEGNPDHPASLGGTDLFTQASVLDLYDPDRSEALTHLGEIRTWSAFLDVLAPNLQALEALGGEGLRILTGAVSSPTVTRLMKALLAKMPKARWDAFEPAARGHARLASSSAFGEVLEARYDLRRADIVLAIDADFLTQGPAAVRYAKDFAARRKVQDPSAIAEMSRLYSIDSMPSPTSTVADHRLALTPAEQGRFVLALAASLGVAGAQAPSGLPEGAGEWIAAVAEDLAAHRGSSLVIAGDFADSEVHVVVAAINESLGNVGATVTYSASVVTEPHDHAESLSRLVEEMRSGDVDTLIVLDANPVYDAPRSLDFAAAMAEVRLRVQLSSYRDETAEHCHWHVPRAHYLESWSDVRAFDGTVTVGQPLIEPLYGGKSTIEVLAALLGDHLATADEIIQDTWREGWQARGEDQSFDRLWRRILHDGVVPQTAEAPKAASLDPSAMVQAAGEISRGASATGGGLELSFRPDPTVYDGRYANNPWLQECPKPITKLTWDNALLMSPRTARDLGFGDLVRGNDQRAEAPLARLTVGERSLDLPVWVVPGHADGALTLHTGYGRWLGGQVANGTGFDAQALRTLDSLWQVREGVSVAPAGGTYLLASTQDHHSMEGRNLVRVGTVEGYRAFADEHGMGAATTGNGHANSGHGADSHGADGHGASGGHHASYPPVHHHGPVDISLMDGKDFPYDSYAWGMSIDLTACTGCNACLLACQAENNIATVGKDQVSKGRELHWIRIDRYFEGESADDVTAILNQPVPCMQCEQAPCEVVCPVAATVHSDEGLNDMVYNRCVGTRYCSNNCPYKVRRFNFFLYSDFSTPSLQLGRNPDVTVRSRGVMEKCTYCVQRINQARVTAKVENRKIGDGEIVTACQGACPSDAIVFGDINDSHSAVSTAKASPLDYRLLEELGTRPRTTYAARIRNPSPRLEPRHGAAAHGEDLHARAPGNGDNAWRT